LVPVSAIARDLIGISEIIPNNRKHYIQHQLFITIRVKNQRVIRLKQLLFTLRAMIAIRSGIAMSPVEGQGPEVFFRGILCRLVQPSSEVRRRIGSNRRGRDQGPPP
jgi:hypothetical protein